MRTLLNFYLVNNVRAYQFQKIGFILGFATLITLVVGSVRTGSSGWHFLMLCLLFSYMASTIFYTIVMTYRFTFSFPYSKKYLFFSYCLFSSALVLLVFLGLYGFGLWSPAGYFARFHDSITTLIFALGSVPIIVRVGYACSQNPGTRSLICSNLTVGIWFGFCALTYRLSSLYEGFVLLVAVVLASASYWICSLKLEKLSLINEKSSSSDSFPTFRSIWEKTMDALPMSMRTKVVLRDLLTKSSTIFSLIVIFFLITNDILFTNLNIRFSDSIFLLALLISVYFHSFSRQSFLKFAFLPLERKFILRRSSTWLPFLALGLHFFGTGSSALVLTTSWTFLVCFIWFYEGFNHRLSDRIIMVYRGTVGLTFVIGGYVLTTPLFDSFGAGPVKVVLRSLNNHHALLVLGCALAVIAYFYFEKFCEKIEVFPVPKGWWSWKK